MAFLKFTADRTVKRLRWVMVGTTLFDQFNTLLGQAANYWQHPNTADEINQSWHYSLSHGLPFYLLDSFVIIVALFLIASLIPKKIALIVMFTAILNHFFGASFWLCYHWNFGVGGPLIYSFILSVVLVLWVFSTNPEKHLCNEPDA
ncbi:MAG TPA: hypothetical protein VNZ25_09145 [Candidatus Angelobacter sp.]|jgi:hypothetical protein|nr:hypothetical protein [Candidatus Angelobacter sp.]